MSGCFDSKDPTDRELERKADVMLETDNERTWFGDIKNLKTMIEKEIEVSE